MATPEQQLRDRALTLLGEVAIGERIVVRFRAGSGATDALGDLVDRTDLDCAVDTRRGVVRVPLDAVVAARRVPPPPERPRP